MHTRSRLHVRDMQSPAAHTSLAVPKPNMPTSVTTNKHPKTHFLNDVILFWMESSDGTGTYSETKANTKDLDWQVSGRMSHHPRWQLSQVPQLPLSAASPK